MPIKIAINGFGRIGRLILRSLIEKPRKNIHTALVNSPSNIETLLHLLKFDSTHGIVHKKIEQGKDWINFDQNKVQFYHEKDPKLLKHKYHKIDLVMECSGRFNNREDAYSHIISGAKKVLVSAPVKNADFTTVYGVNHEEIKLSHKIISNASCTTNCLAPIVKVMDNQFGVVSGNMTTIHSVTNDQNILDNSHKDLRRARAAFKSIVPTSTGAAKAVGLVLPHLKGKIDGTAFRVPAENVSVIDFHFYSKKECTIEEINKSLHNSSILDYKGIISTNNLPLVSSDFNHNPASVIVDLTQTQVQEKRFVKIVGWYDNEWGFANRMLDIAEYIYTKNLA